ncbi:60S acidic ribosomal protein P1-like isoform X2 [Octodon degus]|uniref:60S acidic ribosomal protein P1-like isoform X2 n=1 Tax=Octodon degus TaxID=10160 RepID=A0A6P6DIZ1_OCTDE|nr:60S acidic ribosomal protein P1-like isoform X2 [Octodon degus]
MASISELACTYSILVLHDDEVTALADVNIRSLICNVGAGGPAPAVGTTPAIGPVPFTTATPAEEKKVEAKNKELED